MHVVRCRQINPRFSREKFLRGGGVGGGLGGPNYKRNFGGRGNSHWSEKNSPDLRSPEVGISVYHNHVLVAVLSNAPFTPKLKHV